MTASKKMILDLNTRDISASGTFISTLTSIPEGTRFILDFAIPKNTIEKFDGVRSLDGYTGSIAPSTPHGMAFNLTEYVRLRV